MVLDSSALTVELVVDNPGRIGLSAVGTTLDSRADGCGTHLLRSALRESTENALREHGGLVLGGSSVGGGPKCVVEEAAFSASP